MANKMLRRLSVVLIAVTFALGLFAGLGSAHAMASPTSVTCHQAVDHTSAKQPSPRNCGDGMGLMACPVHVSCVAFVVPVPATLRSRIRTIDWHPVRPSGLSGAGLSPETPPPIASL